jgi:transcription elongation factor GreA
MGRPAHRHALQTPWSARAAAATIDGMTARLASPSVPTPGGVLLTQVELDNVVAELTALRSAHRDNYAQRLRRSRDFGLSADYDDQLAAFEDAVVDEVRIKRLERLIALATVIDDAAAADGSAGLGMVVRVQDGSGRRVEYELVGMRSEDAARPQVTTGSPMGQALLGARAGDTVRVTLPNGRERSLEVLAVIAAQPAAVDLPAVAAAATGR